MKSKILIFLSFLLFFTFSACTDEPYAEDVMNYNSEYISGSELVTDAKEDINEEASEPEKEIIDEPKKILSDNETKQSETEEIINEAESDVISDELVVQPETYTQVEEKPQADISEETISDSEAYNSEAEPEKIDSSSSNVSDIAAPVVIPESTPYSTVENPEEATLENCDYVLNTNSKKIHYPNCTSVKTMAPHNTKYFIGTRDQAVESGYKPCGRCKP